VDHVAKLNDTNFNEFVNGNELTMVMFYDPGCSHCKMALPQYLEASDALHGKGIQIGQINAKQSTTTAALYEVTSYPKYKVFRDGIVRDYDGGRKTRDIVSEMVAAQKSSLIEITTRYDLEKLTESDRHVILAVFETADAPYMMRYEDVCMNQRTDFKCYYTTSLHAVSRYPEIGYDTLTVFRSKFLTSKHERRVFTRPAQGNGAALKRWIHQTSKTLVGERTDRKSLTGVQGPSKLHFETYRPMLVVYYDLDVRPDYYGESKAIFEKIADVANKWNGSVPYARRFIQRSTTGEHLRIAVGRAAEYADTLHRFRLDDSDHDYTVSAPFTRSIAAEPVVCWCKTRAPAAPTCTRQPAHDSLVVMLLSPAFVL
jgi:thiol-disulfide isomerase/thioredoxin